MKVLGAHLIEFWKEWPFGENSEWVYAEEFPFGEDERGALRISDGSGNPSGEEILPEKKYAIDYGVLGWQGRGPAPENFDDDLLRVLRNWIKKRSVSTLVIEVPKGRESEVLSVAAEKGWKVIS